MVCLDSHKISRVLWYSRYFPKVNYFRLRGYHPLWPTFPDRFTNNLLGNFVEHYQLLLKVSRHLVHNAWQLSRIQGLGCSPFARHYWGNLGWFLFLRVLRCFTSPRSLNTPMNSAYHTSYTGGFPHSEISGSKCVCHSPKLIAAYHVLHRFLVPRHPP